MRARQPLWIPSDILTLRIFQRSFSHRTYFRQYRDHSHALRYLKVEHKRSTSDKVRTQRRPAPYRHQENPNPRSGRQFPPTRDAPGRAWWSEHPGTPTGGATGLLDLSRAPRWSRSLLILTFRRQCHATLPGVPEQQTQSAQATMGSNSVSVGHKGNANRSREHLSRDH
jgi:hypothetical protein